jgi:hypothetical protein
MSLSDPRVSLHFLAMSTTVRMLAYKQRNNRISSTTILTIITKNNNTILIIITIKQ